LSCAGFNPVDITGVGEGGTSINGVLAVREDSEAFVILDLVKKKKRFRKGGGGGFLVFFSHCWALSPGLGQMMEGRSGIFFFFSH
jgi:hypothetical protein